MAWEAAGVACSDGGARSGRTLEKEKGSEIRWAWAETMGDRIWALTLAHMSAPDSSFLIFSSETVGGRAKKSKENA